jgi:hypothetical protein
VIVVHISLAAFLGCIVNAVLCFARGDVSAVVWSVAALGWLGSACNAFAFVNALKEVDKGCGKP